MSRDKKEEPPKDDERPPPRDPANIETRDGEGGKDKRQR